MILGKNVGHGSQNLGEMQAMMCLAASSDSGPRSGQRPGLPRDEAVAWAGFCKVLVWEPRVGTGGKGPPQSDVEDILVHCSVL